MNIHNEIDYMISCLRVAQEEWKKIEEDSKNNVVYYGAGRYIAPNRSLIRDNLRNVARMGFRVANKIECGTEE